MNTRPSALFSIFAIFPIFLGALTVNAQAELFPRNLTVGDFGEDVRTLQKILNEFPDTRVAEAGAGSPGQETDYFGSLTRSAVVRFQEKNRPAILTPIGLSYGTGLVGPATRAFLQHLQTKKEVSEVEPLPVPSKIQPVKNEPLSVFNNVFLSTEDLFIMFPSRYFGPAGTSVTIHGSGFSTVKNTIHFGEIYTLADIPAENPGRLSFVVPAYVPQGIYDLWVSNAVAGKTRTSDKDAFFVITPAGAKAPAIESVAPARAKWGDTITIRGAGFAPQGNIIRTGFEIIRDVPSPDGSTISFVTKPAVFADAVAHPYATEKTVGFPVEAYVVNGSGVSGSGKFIFEI